VTGGPTAPDTRRDGRRGHETQRRTRATPGMTDGSASGMTGVARACAVRVPRDRPRVTGAVGPEGTASGTPAGGALARRQQARSHWCRALVVSLIHAAVRCGSSRFGPPDAMHHA